MNVLNSTFLGGEFEGNCEKTAKARSLNLEQGGPYVLLGVLFVGDGHEYFAFTAQQSTFVIGCSFIGHSTAAIECPSAGTQLVTMGNSTTDPAFLYESYLSPTVQSPAAGAGSMFVFGSQVTSPSVQTLSANGAVTFNALSANLQLITLSANATSSSIPNPQLGQVMTIAWRQDAKGGHTYAWPSNWKFANGAAPTPSTTAGYTDSVTAFFDGTNWIEVSRALEAH
jgi:hypothetical protein